MKRSDELILIVDDLKTNRLVMMDALKDEGYDFIEASNGQEAIEMAKKHLPQVIIMDGIMPKMDGFEAVKILREFEEFKRTPILMISSLTEDHIKVRAIEAGVNDFITKPFEKMELIMRCRSYMDIAHTNSQYILSTKNPNTKLPNIVALKNRLQSKKEESIILLRVDHFRLVDAFYGSEYTKIVELEFAKYLTYYFDELDIKVECYHTFEGEYAIVFDNFDKEMAHLDIDEFCKMFHEHIKLHEIDLDKFSYDIVATICFAQGYDNLYEDASFALDYAVENSLRYVIMSDIIDSLKQKTRDNINMINILKNAIDDNRIVAYFQPIYDNKDEKIIKYEALVRLVKEDGDLLSPFFFIDVAKGANYYYHITSIMIDRVFDTLRSEQKELTINISYIDMITPQIADKLFKNLNLSSKIASMLTLEILEDEKISDDKIFKDFIFKAKSYGAKIAIDDFGSGYSNFQRLMDIDPDFVKIDGSIIKNIVTDKKSFILARSINQFSHSLGIKTVAEFVSDEDIQKIVCKMGIDYSQGYLIGKPDSILIDMPEYQKDKIPAL